jgi:hypothetical protein
MIESTDSILKRFFGMGITDILSAFSRIDICVEPAGFS